MDDACRQEIDELHRFFEGWFTGTLPDTDDEFERLSSVLDHGFEMISPDGLRSDRTELVTGLRRMHSVEKGKAFKIVIRGYRGRSLEAGLHLATYEEWQERRGTMTGRRSTALFRREPGTTNGVRWLHVHETWLPPGP